MPEADKRAFWAYFFQALAGAEAGLGPKTRVRHKEAAVAVKDEVKILDRQVIEARKPLLRSRGERRGQARPAIDWR